MVGSLLKELSVAHTRFNSAEMAGGEVEIPAFPDSAKRLCSRWGRRSILEGIRITIRRTEDNSVVRSAFHPARQARSCGRFSPVAYLWEHALTSLAFELDNLDRLATDIGQEGCASPQTWAPSPTAAAT